MALARSRSGTSTSRFLLKGQRCLLKGQRSTCQSRNLFRTTYPSSHRRSSLPSGIGRSHAGRLEDPRRVLALSRSTSPSRCQSKAQLTRCPERRFRTRCLSFHRGQGLLSGTDMRERSRWVVETRKMLTIRSLSRGRQMHEVQKERKRQSIGSKYRSSHLR